MYNVAVIEVVMNFSGIEKMSLVDYDGYVSATVFTPGCNFRCGFCHNSPLVLGTEKLPIIPEEEILSYLTKRKGILEGLCITGGEPTLQKELPLFCEKVKNLGYKVKVDTNGTSPEMVKTLFSNGLADYFAMDIKADKNSYAKIIGFDSFDTAKIQQTISFFLTEKVNYEFRTTLIKEFHNEQVVINIGQWIKGANKYFLQKFKDSENCIQSHLSPVDENIVLKFQDILKDYIPNTYLRGYGI